jgi:hypothetical protein
MQQRTEPKGGGASPAQHLAGTLPWWRAPGLAKVRKRLDIKLDMMHDPSEERTYLRPA